MAGRAALLPLTIMGLGIGLLSISCPAGAQDAPKPKDAPVPEQELEAPDRRDPARAPKIAIFRAAGFPTIDAPEIDPKILDAALAGLPVETLPSAEQVKNRLKVKDFDVFVLPYGSAFPLGAWTTIRSFLEHGGGLVVLGGAPFHRPIRFEAEPVESREGPKPGDAREGSKPDSKPSEPKGRWVAGARQPTFARDLLIGPAEIVRVPPGDALVPKGGFQWDGTRPANVYELTVRLTTKKDFKEEDGSAGPRDAILRPLFHFVGQDSVPTACPLLEIDRLRGSEAGARWVLAPCDGKLGSSLIRACVERALAGAFELDARPVHAAVEPGEEARIRVAVRRPFVPKGEAPIPTIRARAGGPGGNAPVAGDLRLTGPAEDRAAEFSVAHGGKPGYYEVEIQVDGVPPEAGKLVTAFWVRDPAAPLDGSDPRDPKITVSRDWLRKDGKVFPIVGTTYMASDVHRKFLFEPNPYLWDRDFDAMSRQGVNFVRTGLWTGWQRAMLDPGAIDEGVLRALDAFVLTARRHRIVVCFNFFAFQPPMFGGSNPFLDPRSIAGQKALVSLVARRYRGCGWIHYDLINEPSYTPPDQLWQNRPIGDEHEKRAWADWLRARHGNDQTVLRDRWRDPQGELLAMPKPEEINYSATREARRPRKVGDFHRFSNDVVAAWARELRAAILEAGGPGTLVTLGQDEGGTWLRPSQQILADSVDYTAVHTWWNNDDLLWDSVVTKVPEKASVVQETGLMRLEDLDGAPWRTPEEAARLLERKFALAFAARGAGAIQWAWNINPFMPVENESVIGIFRPDGTAKPELRVLREFSRFFAEAAPALEDFEPDPVVVVLPQSRLFVGRPYGADAVKGVVRALADHFGVVPTALSELRLTDKRLEGAKLVIVPCAEMLEETAAAALLAASKRGAKILFTGWIDGDPYGRVTDSLAALGVCDRGRSLAFHEPTRWTRGRELGFLTFDGNRGEWLRAAACGPLTAFEGNVWHEPLPLEFARETSALRALLGEALAAAAVEAFPGESPLTVRVLKTKNAALLIGVNEGSTEAARAVTIDGRATGLRVPPGLCQILLIDRATGEVRARM